MDGDCSSFRAETKYCGKQEPAPFFSTGNKLCVKFFSDESQAAQGFSATYEAVDRPTNPGGIEFEIELFDYPWIRPSSIPYDRFKNTYKILINE